MVEFAYNPYKTYQVEKLRFYAFQQPYVCKFIEELQKGGIAGLLTLANQRWTRDRAGYKDSNLPSLSPPKGPFFQYQYSPTDVVDKEYPRFNVDFDVHGAYAQYNWEMFFHIPLFIATRLMQDQRHEEAMRWFHYIFSPMTEDKAANPERYWNFKPFRDQDVPERIQELLWTLQDPKANQKKKEDVEQAIGDWRKHPFHPHRIARGRPGAYMKTVVMKYIDNLIAWGDKLFRRDTIESINEATQLYILAANLLGVRPQRVPPVVKEKEGPPTYNTLRKTLDAFSNGIVQVEHLIPFSFGSNGSGGSNGTGSILGLANLVFCIPHNEKLLGYWDTVEDRLFKIRHCMNIEGVRRQLPLFEPPIDPALLVRATAMGLDLSQVLDDLAAPLPHYRFTFMLQKAREFCEELKQLGGLLLSALEKRDAEKLSQIRATHEKDLLKAVLEVKKKQVKEAEETQAGLEEAEILIMKRRDFYRDEPKRLPQETEAMKEAENAQDDQEDAAKRERAASAAAAITPETQAGTSGGFVHSVFTWGFPNVIAGIKAYAQSATISSLEHEAKAQNLERMGQLLRRDRDYKLQETLADQELRQVKKQIAAADIRLQIAENELANHEKQIEQAEEVEDFLRGKFTNQDLYAWMVSQVSAVYFQSYKLAYDLAKRAERLYRHELGVTDSSIVQFGAWDTLRKGLLAGEKLSLDLRRLEHAYLERNKREYELTKHISLRQLNPIALLTLKATGTCTVDVPEWLFDLDAPGHYMRRIKTVALSIPSVVGPYTSVSCTLSLLESHVRKSSLPKNNLYKRQGSEDDRFVDYTGAVQSIVTSGASNDSGLFETNLRDERFLPFEGAGVDSRWRLDLPPKAYRAFDYNTISDVILHVRYTARQGVDPTIVKAWLTEVLKPETDSNLALLFSLRHDFPTEWSAFVNGTGAFKATIRKEYMPYLAHGKTITVTGVDLYDGTNVANNHAVAAEVWESATDDLADPPKQAFTFIAPEDKTEPKVLIRKPDAQVFLIIRYKLS